MNINGRQSSLLARHTVPDVAAEYLVESTQFYIPQQSLFHATPGLRPRFEETFGLQAASVILRRQYLDPRPWDESRFDSGTKEDSDRAKMTDLIVGMFPRWNGCKLGMDDLFNQERKLGWKGQTGVDIRYDITETTSDIVPDSQDSHPEDAKIDRLCHRFEQNDGAFTTAGYFEDLKAAPHGACSWLKLHYGELRLRVDSSPEAPSH